MKKSEAHKTGVIICGLALCDYRPKKWGVLKEHLQETTIFNSPTTRSVLWLKTAAALCVLDLYKIEVLEKTLQADFVKSVLLRGDLNLKFTPTVLLAIILQDINQI